MVVLVGVHNTGQSPVHLGSSRLVNLLTTALLITKSNKSYILIDLQEPDEFILGGIHDELHCLVHQLGIKRL